MNQKIITSFLILSLAATVMLTTDAGVAIAQVGQEKTGQVQQQLAGGTVVANESNEENGLVTLNSATRSCSGSLLRDNWIITAAHCVEGVAEDGVTVTANWRRSQMRRSMRIISFRPNDVALIRIADPFNGGPNEGFNRGVYQGKRVPLAITFFGRGVSEFAKGEGATAVSSKRSDGQYRVGYFTTDKESDQTYSFPSGTSQGAPGDSGGPSYANNLIVGVHSKCERDCLKGKTCAPDDWTWVAGTPRCTDAAVAPLWDDINRYLGAFVPRRPFIGTFGSSPPNYQPIWVYAIKNNGDLLWYRKETNSSKWIGPKPVNNGWDFKDVIPAGGNSFYALTHDGNLIWHRHDSFNDGSKGWSGPHDVGGCWDYSKIFSGGEGIVYAIKNDGTLLWYRNADYANGSKTWDGPKVVGSGWGIFKDVFSTGRGVIYGVHPDGKLSRYLHEGYSEGASRWVGPRNAGKGWHKFRQIVPVGSGVLLAITEEGQLLHFKYNGNEQEKGPVGIGVNQWENGIAIGSGWVGFRKVFAVLPASPPVIR